jgi:hypothetical protein
MRLNTLLWCKIAANAQLAKSIYLDTHNGLVDSQEKMCDNTMLSASNSVAQDLSDTEIQAMWEDILVFRDENLKPLVKRI